MHDRHLDPRAIGGTSRFLDRDGNFQALAVAPTDCAAPIADDNQAGETKPAATFDDAGAPPDLQDVLDLLGP